MSRFGTGLGFNIQDIALISGIATEIFNANVANLNGGYFNAGNPTDLQVSGDVSFGSNLKSTDAVNLQQVVKKAAPSLAGGMQNILYNYPSAGKITVSIYYDLASPKQVILTSIGTYTTGVECRTIANYKDGILDLWINGVLDNSVTAVGGCISNTSADLVIGGDSPTLGVNLFKGTIYNSFMANRGLTTDEIDILSTSPTKCFDLMPGLSDIALFVPLYNHAGFTGQEVTNQGAGTIVIVNVNSVPFTGSAQIECEA